MAVENQREDGGCDRFPVGMRVLAVDDDPICLKVLENLLRKCQYHVTTTNQAVEALTMLRENRNKFDLVISDVNMPDIDGFKLLELVGLEMDLPVIMLSAHGDTKLVMKGVTHGACDYLLKPVRIEELKNIWQHVVRRKNFDSRDQNKASNEEKAPNFAGGGSQGLRSENSADQNKRLGKKRKDQSDEEEEGGEENEDDEDPSAQKKARVVWSVELHRKFVAAVNQLGLDKAVPKKILDLMNVEGLTRENVASHLQKYRLYLKKAAQQANMVAALGGSDSYLRIGSIDGYGDFCTSSGSGRITNATLPSYASTGIFSRLNSPAALNMRGISSSALIRPVQSQNINSSLNTLGNIQPSIFPANQSSSLLQGIPTSIELNQSKQRNCTTGISQLSQVDSSGFTVASGFPDHRATVNGPNNSLPCVSNNHIMLQGNPQTHGPGAFSNQSSVRAASLCAESFDVGLCGSSNLLDHNRCNDNWQNAAQLSKFPANSLPLCEAPTSSIMKYLIALALVAVAAARPDVSHLLGQQHHHAPPPAILRQVQETSEQGDYKFNFKTENGIEAVGQAQLKNAGSKDEALVSEGTYSYVGDDGQTYSVNWVADEFGFRASGAHIPEIPEEIKRGLEQSANEPEDDGQYREDPNSYDRPQQPFRQ